MRRLVLAASLLIISGSFIFTDAEGQTAGPAKNARTSRAKQTAARERALLEMAQVLQAKHVAARERALRLARKLNWPITEIMADGRTYSLQSIQNGMPQYYTTCNADAAVSTRGKSLTRTTSTASS